MRSNLTVHVPKNNSVSYSLYAMGMKISVPHTSDDESEWIFRFAGGSAVVLIYSFERYRRAYIVTAWESGKDGEKSSLPGVDEDVCILGILEGRKIGRMERLVRHLSREDEYAPFRFPLLFWYRFSVMLKNRKDYCSDVDNLARIFIKDKKNGKNDLCSKVS